MSDSALGGKSFTRGRYCTFPVSQVGLSGSYPSERGSAAECVGNTTRRCEGAGHVTGFRLSFGDEDECGGAAECDGNPARGFKSFGHVTGFCLSSGDKGERSGA